MLDELIPELEDWSISHKNKGSLLRQYCCPTAEPGVMTRINIYTNGTVFLSGSPNISSREFKQIIKNWEVLVDAVKDGLSKKQTSDQILSYIS